MAEFNSAEKLNIDFAEEYSTDVMTGDRNKRMYLYYQLINSLKKADSVDIIVSFLMESGVMRKIVHSIPSHTFSIMRIIVNCILALLIYQGVH